MCQQVGNLRNQLRGEGSAGEGHDLDHVAAAIRVTARQGDAAVLARSVGSEKKHGTREEIPSQIDLRQSLKIYG